MTDISIGQAEGLRIRSRALLDYTRLLFSIDLRTLAAFRIMLSVAVLYSLFAMLPDVDAFLTDQGVLPRADLLSRMSSGRLSLYLVNGSYPFALGLVLLNIAAALALMVGYRTRAAAVLCWILYISMVKRNFLIAQGGDALLPLLLFWTMFLPTGAVFSVDAAMDSENRRSQAPHLSIASVGLLLQVVYVYVFGALLKRSPEWIPDGVAVFMAISLDTFATPLAHWFRQFPLITVVLTFYVWFLELFAPVLLFFPDRRQWVRSFTLALLATMHFGFRLFLNIGHFWLASLASITAFIPGYFWNWVGNNYWRREQERIVLYYDQNCGFCRKTTLLLREFFLPRQVEVLPAQSVPEIGEVLQREVSWVVVDWAGNRYLHWDALVFVIRQSKVARPLAWILAAYGGLGLGRPTYALIGRKRAVLSRLSSSLLLEQTNRFRLSALSQTFLCGVILLCFAWNMREHYGSERSAGIMPRAAVQIAYGLGLDQRWSMFAPHPLRSDFRPTIEGRTQDGSVVDVFHRRFSPPAQEATGNVMHSFPSYRWRKYINRIASYGEKRRQFYFRRYATHLCQDWNDRWGGKNALESLTITLMKNRFVTIHSNQKTVQEIGTWRCDDN